MRASPSITPDGSDQDTYLVLDDFGGLGRAWRETVEEDADRETLIRDLFSGEYRNPVRIVVFNIAEGWCRDVTVEIADELLRRWAERGEISESVPRSWRPTGAEGLRGVLALVHGKHVQPLHRDELRSVAG